MADDELLGRIQAAVEKAGRRASDRLRAAVEAHTGFVVDHQVASPVASGEIRYLAGVARKRVVAARDSTQGRYEEIVAAGAAATPYPDDAARNIVSMCAAIATWYHPEGRLSREELAARHAHYALALLQGPL